jgi:hypothetical protein
MDLAGDRTGLEDGEKVEWAMNAVLRGVKEPWAVLYTRFVFSSSPSLTLHSPRIPQTLVSSILLRFHPNQENAPLLSAASFVWTTIEPTGLKLLWWIGI